MKKTISNSFYFDVGCTAFDGRCRVMTYRVLTTLKAGSVEHAVPHDPQVFGLINPEEAACGDDSW